MMYIGLVSGRLGCETQLVLKELNKRKIKHIFIDPQRIFYEFKKGALNIFFEGKNLNKLSIVLIRQAHNCWQEVQHMVSALSYLGIPTVDQACCFSGPSDSKLQALIQGLPDGIPYPESSAGFYFEDFQKFIRTPSSFLVKPENDSRSRNVVKITSSAHLKNYLYNMHKERKYRAVILQNFLNIKAEYRALLVGRKVLGIVKRGEQPGRITRLVSKGERVNGRLDLNKLALIVAKNLKLELAGIDMAETIEGKLYVLEGNANPCFKGFMQVYPEINVAGEIVDYLLSKIKNP